MFLSALALASAAFAGGGYANPAIKTYDGGWALYKNDDNCALMRDYDANTTLHVSYYGTKNNVRITMIDPALKDVVDNAKYKFQLLFLKGDNLDKGWGTVNVDGVVLSSGDKGYGFTTNGQTFLDDMGKNDLFGLMDGDKVIESLKLDKVGPALEGLKACAAAVSA